MLATIWADIPRKKFANSKRGRTLLEKTNTVFILEPEDELRPCDVKKTFDEKILEGANYDQDEVLKIQPKEEEDKDSQDSESQVDTDTRASDE